jgi:predicted nucleic-acid-binding protein
MLAGNHELVLTDVILAEAVFVLESFYRLGRGEIASLARSMLALPSVEAPGLDPLLRALELYELDRLDFAEAYVAASAELSGIRRVASFDRQIDRVPSVLRVEP